MNRYLAKSDPEQPIQEHTDKLLENLEVFKKIYPELKIDYELLRWACIYHDLGKMNVKFQNKIENKSRSLKEIPHGILSLPFINYVYFEEQGYTEEQIKILFQAVAYHHNREFNFEEDELIDEIQLLKNEVNNFKYKPLEGLMMLNDSIEEQFFVINERTYGNSKDFFEYVLLKGLLNRLDYAASAEIDVETENNFLSYKLEKLNFQWNALQNFMIEHQNDNVVVVAQTGMGKTEAGLLWIGDNKGFFTLPLKTAINEIYKRIVNNIVGKSKKDLIGLLHSDTYSKYLENEDQDEDIEEYFTKTKQLSLPLTVCTLDQLFDFVFRYRDFESKLATLSYSKVVIDEVQMYSDDLLAYLILGISYISRIGGKFAILTATLPGIVTDLMLKEGIKFTRPDNPFIDDGFVRHSLKVEDCSINAEIIARSFNSNKILVICNTVKKAQEIYSELSNNEELKRRCDSINLFHGKFIQSNRRQKEEAIVEFGNIHNRSTGIWVATQVVEASLDMDFDLLFTELSDINGLFQRMGRCYRKRPFDKDGYNCYVFTGGTEKCSGVGSVIDKEIFEFSKCALKNIDGEIRESKKLSLIDEVYCTEKLKNTEYFKSVVRNIEYVKSINEYELSKAEVKKLFRNIHNVTIIPQCVYIENREKIDTLISRLTELENEKKKVSTKQERIELRREKKKTLDNIFSFSLDIRQSIFDKKKKKQITECKYKPLYICEGFTYDCNLGLKDEGDKEVEPKKAQSNFL